MKFIRRTDLIVLLALVILAGGGWFGYKAMFGGRSAQAEIYYYSELVMTVDLTKGEDRHFSVPEVPAVVFHLYADGSIAFEESDCPDKVCIRTGRIDTVGQSAACLPNGLVMKIVPNGGRRPDDIDIVA